MRKSLIKMRTPTHCCSMRRSAVKWDLPTFLGLHAYYFHIFDINGKFAKITSMLKLLPFLKSFVNLSPIIRPLSDSKISCMFQKCKNYTYVICLLLKELWKIHATTLNSSQHIVTKCEKNRVFTEISSDVITRNLVHWNPSTTLCSGSMSWYNDVTETAITAL